MIFVRVGLFLQSVFVIVSEAVISSLQPSGDPRPGAHRRAAMAKADKSAFETVFLALISDNRKLLQKNGCAGARTTARLQGREAYIKTV